MRVENKIRHKQTKKHNETSRYVEAHSMVSTCLKKSQYYAATRWQFNDSMKQPTATLFRSGRYFYVSKLI